MARTSYPLCLVLFVIALVCSARQANGVQIPLAKGRAMKMINQLNLFPPDDINRGLSHSLTEANQPTLVEKQFKFNYLGESGATVENLGHHAGYYKLPNTKDSRMFYFFFESRTNKSDPVVIWLSGGPGCSSSLALFFENGPFYISADSRSLVWNNYGWDKVSNIIYVDQPMGTGFSHISNDEDIRHDETGVSNDLYGFLQEFFKAHGAFAKNDFFITGESYAGHYIPALAFRISQGNKKKQGVHIRLKGMAIGNGLTNPEIQYPAYIDFAFHNKLITKIQYENLTKQIPNCQEAIRKCNSVGGESACDEHGLAYSTCQTPIFGWILDNIGYKNYYDIRKNCEGGSGSLCYNLSNVETFLNNRTVKATLGVGNIEFVSCSETVSKAMASDLFKNLTVGIPALLEDGVTLLVYAGEYDFICNYLGNIRWVQALQWSGQRRFGAAPNITFTVDGEEKGKQKSYGPLTFLKVYDAGHLVPMDQPKASLEMLRRWMHGHLSKP